MVPSFYVYRGVPEELVNAVCGQIPGLYNGTDLVISGNDRNDVVQSLLQTLDNNYSFEEI